MTNLEMLHHKRNRLVDLWQNASGQEKVKILVQIMDLDEDIDDQIQANKGNSMYR
ncbi:MAG: hypothetical protein ACYDG6_00355 [Thermincolia bacterium]